MLMSHLFVQANMPEGGDPYETIFAIAVIVVIFVILYLARERRFKSKYNPSKRHEEDIRDWGGMSGGGPIGDPRDQ